MNIIKTSFLSKDKLSLDLSILENDSPVWIIFIHGLGEHKERHSYLFDIFSTDFNIAMLDLRGHGKSEGQRTDIDDFNLYIQDLLQLLMHLINNYKLKKYIIMGHSMGGLIVTSFLQENLPLQPLAAFLSSPAIGSSGLANKIFDFISKSWIFKLAELKKGIYLKGLLDLKKLSHNYEVYENYVRDPLNSLHINSRLLFKIINQGFLVRNSSRYISCPLYGAIGTGDVLVSLKDCISFFAQLNRECDLKIIKDAYHELHNEISIYKDPYIHFLKTTLLKYRYSNESI